MRTIGVPYHQAQLIPDFDVGVPVDTVVTVDLPDADAWRRMSVLYEELARVVRGEPLPMLVVSGACLTSLGLLAGLQRAGRDPGIVWVDAHGDFNTEATTPSGYLGGMPLALAVGVGTRPCRTSSGCIPWPLRRWSSSAPGISIPPRPSCSSSRPSHGEASTWPSPKCPRGTSSCTSTSTSAIPPPFPICSFRHRADRDRKPWPPRCGASWERAASWPSTSPPRGITTARRRRHNGGRCGT